MTIVVTSPVHPGPVVPGGPSPPHVCRALTTRPSPRWRNGRDTLPCRSRVVVIARLVAGSRTAGLGGAV